MPYNIFRTTADHVIGATDASLQRSDGVDVKLVADFLDTPQNSALNALKMAEQIGLLSENQGNVFNIASPCATYLITSSRDSKAAVLRFILEQYEPYRTFKYRLNITTGVVGEAAVQTRAIHNISAHRDVIVSTLVDLGTYSKSLTSQGAGLYIATEEDPIEYLRVLQLVIQERENAELTVRRRIGLERANWIDPQNVLPHLVTAYQRLVSAEHDPRAPIVHAGNAIESFLTQVANHNGTNLQNANGINAKADKIAQNNNLTKKHKFMFKYLGHVRNAADHGIDAEINVAWDINPNTAIEYVHVALTLIGDTVEAINGHYIV